MVKRFKLHVVDSEWARTEFENYCNKIVEGHVTNIPIDAFNHGIDPLRYVVVAHWAYLVKEQLQKEAEEV